MAGIEHIDRPVYRAKTANRCYLTLRAAVNAEAVQIIRNKYPDEAAQFEGGRCYDPGFHWSNDERLVRVHKRLMRLILKAYRDELKNKESK